MEKKSIEFKLNTGSPCTVIGLDLLKKANIDLTREIEKIGLQDKLVDASGGDIRIAPYIVQDYRGYYLKKYISICITRYRKQGSLRNGSIKPV